MNAEKPNERGFTLIEVLVAFAILAFTLSAAYGVFSDAARATASSEKHGAALAIAQAKMAEFEGYPADQPPSGSGETEGGFAWRIESRDMPGFDMADAPVPVLLTVIVEWGTGQTMSIETIRLRQQQ